MKLNKKPHNKLILTIIFFILSFSLAKAQVSLTKALDYDGDGRVDSIIYRPGKTTWWYVQNSTAGYVAFQYGNFLLDTPTPGDYDGDGKGDLAFWRESDGTFNYLRSSNNTFFSQQFGMTGDEPLARDYDGDGKTDLAVLRRANGYLYWYNINSSNNSFTGVQYGLSNDRPAPGDYDGDGKFDYAVQRPDSRDDELPAVFYINKSSGGAAAVAFGRGSDKIVPGDYDGDGKTDIAYVRDDIYDQNTNSPALQWEVIRSSNGSAARLDYGNADLGDIPVQGDYNGDGITDIAVWRSAEGNFYIYGVGAYHFGNRGDLPVASYDTH